MSISELKLEQLAAGELGADEAALIRARLDDDADAKARFELIESTTPKILERYTPNAVCEEVARRVRIVEARDAMAGEPSGFERLILSLRWVAAVACIAGAMTFLVPDKDQEQPDFRLKGATAELVVHRVVADVAERLEQETPVRMNDRLQVSIVGGRGRHVVVISIDGRGQVTLHHPQSRETKPLRDQKFSLPTSYQLDDAPAYERFFLVSSLGVLSPQAVVEAARVLVAKGGAESGELGGFSDSVEVKSLRLVKGSP